MQTGLHAYVRVGWLKQQQLPAKLAHAQLAKPDGIFAAPAAA
jgi:hypothetical protein